MRGTKVVPKIILIETYALSHAQMRRVKEGVFIDAEIKFQKAPFFERIPLIIFLDKLTGLFDPYLKN